MQPKLIIHGGAGSALDGKGGAEAVRKSLYSILGTVYPLLVQGLSATEAVVQAAQQLEDDPLFNAGTGSVLQIDGQIRMSAALMDGARHSFSGVINVSRVQHPIELADYLQGSDDRILSDYGSAELARELNVPLYNPLTQQRLEEWWVESQHDFKKRMGSVTTAGVGTIGAVALDELGRLAAATSTGGRGFERIGRVSDSAMPAGNYADEQAAVSCTGIGEHIIDEALATRIVVRVTDGLSLSEAFDRSFAEARSRNRYFGAIGLDARGEIAWGKTSEVLLAAYHDGERIGDTL